MDGQRCLPGRSITEDLPALPWELFQRLQEEFELSDYDANLLTAELSTARYFLELSATASNPKAVANLIINKLLPYCQENELELQDFPVGIAGLGKFIQLIGAYKKHQIRNLFS